ncbi:MAG: preprotein translocase subunit SecG [Bacteroidetes bacterium]|jgi:preprotein translocase subunit SecG|nr:preprotein translocase subunit SecG [Bacteroidota bacterium]MBP6428153.1 preprotein translocase subunit SecG [Bacteroidia bacterium]MBK8362872.1 preprotein translocase subunit SecG [Bacteroidota bacterium]MBK9413780.1 preprotein translocase subunit SecG [Bacteroidota bacterium]MBL0032928.1 preprotein translocase subunit SecG [Bacteroidota bacterium]
MYTAVTVLIILTSVLLVLVVLVQNPKGGGISSGIIGSNQVMGVKKTTDFIEKLTWGLVLTLIGLCLVAGMALPNKDNRGAGSRLEEQIENAPVNTNPGTPPPGQQQQAQPNQQPAEPAPAK